MRHSVKRKCTGLFKITKNTFFCSNIKLWTYFGTNPNWIYCTLFCKMSTKQETRPFMSKGSHYSQLDHLINMDMQAHLESCHQFTIPIPRCWWTAWLMFFSDNQSICKTSIKKGYCMLFSIVFSLHRPSWPIQSLSRYVRGLCVCKCVCLCHHGKPLPGGLDTSGQRAYR